MEQNNTPPAASTPPKSDGGKKAVWIVVAIVVVLAIIWYFMAHKSGGNAAAIKSSTDTAMMQNQQSASPAQQSLKNLMQSGTPQTCMVNFQNQGNQSQGTIYIASGKMRGDFSYQTNGQTGVSHMINDGQNIYTWMDGMSTGFKMAATTAMQNSTSTPMQHQQGIDPNANYQFNCSPWSVDNSQFAPPANVNFNSMMMNMPGQTSTPTGSGSASMGAQTPVPNKAAECAACNSAPASAQAQCKAALGC